MKYYLGLSVFLLQLTSCKEANTKTATRVFFERSNFKNSLIGCLKELDWKGKGGSGSSSGGRSRHIGKYSKEGETIYVYYEMSSDKTKAYNLHFIGNFIFMDVEGLDETHTQELVEKLSADLAWFKDKVKFVDDIETIRNGIQLQPQP